MPKLSLCGSLVGPLLALFLLISPPLGAQPAPDPSEAAPKPAASEPAPAAKTPAQTPDTAAPTSSATEGEFHLLFTSDIYGRYAWPGCGTRSGEHADLAHLVSMVQQRRRALAKAGKGQPVVVAAGSMIRPDIMGRHIFGPGKAWAPTAVNLIKSVGFDGISVGGFDFGASSEAFQRYLTLMDKAEQPLLAANVTCEEKDDFRCKHLGWQGKRYRVVERGGLRVGIFSVVREDLAQRILARSVGSIQVADPVKTAKELIGLLRGGLKVDLVVMLAPVNVEGDAPMTVIDFVRNLGDEGPDLVVTDTMYNRKNKDFIQMIRSANGPPILGTDRFGQHLGEAKVRYRRTEKGLEVEGVRVEMHRTVEAKPVPRDARFAVDLLRELCRTVNEPLGRAKVQGSLTYEQFRTYVMEIMRQRTGAEIVILNDSALADTGFPMSGPITREKVLRAIRTETKLGYFKMQPAMLAKKLGFPYVLGGQPGLHVLGLARKANKKWYINNRLANDGHHYKVAATKFVAEGGDGLFSLWTEQFEDSGVSLPRAVIDFFQDGGSDRDGDPAVNLEKDFVDPWDEFLLFSGLDLGLSLTNVAVANISTRPSGGGTAGYERYNQPLLQRDSQIALQVDLGIGLGASNRNHAVDADVALQYGHSWTTTRDEKLAAAGDDTRNERSVSAETADRIRLDLLYKLTLWRNKEVPALWYMPVPFAELTLLSEFTSSGIYTNPNTGKSDEYHFLDLSGTLGVGMLPHPFLFFKAGFAVAGELLTPDAALAQDDHQARTGAYLGLHLRRMKLNQSIYHPVQFESRLDFFMTGIGDLNRKELTWSSKLYFNVVPMIYVTASHQLYVFDTDNDSTSVANDITFGVDFLFDYRHQLF